MRAFLKREMAPRPHEPGLALHVEDLTVSYQARPVLWDIDLDIPPGVMAAIVGPNGAGKSSFLKAVLELVPKTAGHVRVFGEPYARARKRVAYVPQRSSVDWDFPTTALDVVMMGRYGHLGWFRRPGAETRARALGALEEVGIADLAGRQISQLSGGQQQRVFLARALVQEADLYFLDEPMAGVDATTERAIVALLQRLRDRGKTVVVVHHDLQTVRRYYDWVVILNVRVIAQGPVAEVHTRENLRRAYGGQIALLGEDDGGALASAPLQGMARADVAGMAAGGDVSLPGNPHDARDASGTAPADAPGQAGAIDAGARGPGDVSRRDGASSSGGDGTTGPAPGAADEAPERPARGRR